MNKIYDISIDTVESVIFVYKMVSHIRGFRPGKITSKDNPCGSSPWT